MGHIEAMERTRSGKQSAGEASLSGTSAISKQTRLSTKTQLLWDLSARLDRLDHKDREEASPELVLTDAAEVEETPVTGEYKENKG